MEARLGSFNPSMVLKYLSTEEVKKRWELNLYALGSIGIKDLESAQGDEFDIIKSFFYSKAYTIAGGSSEIQLNIISKNILGLPND
jgi:alkylation response protein AidB-like acyl-CoA dehydrogenase